MSRPALPALTLVLCACGSDLTSPFSAVAVTYDVKEQAFKLAQVRVNTLTSLRHLQGCLQLDAKGNCQPGMKLDVTAGGSVRVSTAAVRDPSATVDSLRAAFVKARPGAPSARLANRLASTTLST